MSRFFSILILCILFIFSSEYVDAQRKIKYKDAFDMILSGDNEKSYSLLLEYQKQDPEFINTYLQVGLISLDWAKKYDPLTDIELVELFIYNTKLYLGLAKGKLQLDPKDVKKNKDYYMNIDVLKQIDKIEYEDAVNYIDSKIDEVNKLDKNIHKIAGNFNSCIEYYNICSEIYKQINFYNSKLKDIYLYPSEDLSIKIEKIITSYDSALYFFENYKNAIKNYPIGNYNQQIYINQIQTYRLDGFTNSNFLNNEIQIWDFKTWAENLSKIINSDITDLRTEIASTNMALNDKEITISKYEGFSDELSDYILDDKLIFKIEKYDYNSIISTLFNYRKSKINLLVHSKKNFNNPSDTTVYYDITKRAKLNYQTVLKYKNADSLLEILNSRISEENVKKFESFFDSNYKGYSGILSYKETQSKELNSVLNESFSNFKKCLFNENINLKNDTFTINYQNSKVPLYVVKPDFNILIAKNYYTTSVEKDLAENYYISGYLADTKTTQSFIAKASSKSKIEWLKTFYTDANSVDYITCSEIYSSGIIFTINSLNLNTSKNAIVKLNGTGIQILKTDLSETLIPRVMRYDEINENVIIAYKGTEYNEFDDKTENLVIEKFNLLTQKNDWKTEINISGNIFGIQKIDTIYYVFCNFTKFTDLNGEIQNSNSKNKSGKNIVIIKISESGKITDFNPILSSDNIYGSKAIKINNEIFNIIGFEGEKYEINTFTELNNSSLIYILLDKNNNIIFSNWQD